MYKEQIKKELKEEVTDSIRILIGDFSILWNMYEKHYLKRIKDDLVSKLKSENSNKRIQQEDIHDALINKLIRESFIEKYEKEINKNYNSLEKYMFEKCPWNCESDGKIKASGINKYFRVDKHENPQNEVNNVLNKDVLSTSDKLHILLIVAYRVRNNMFHGLKGVNELNEERELFYICNDVFSLLLNPLKQYIHSDILID